MSHFFKNIFIVILLMLMLFLNCKNTITNVPEQGPKVVLTKERVLYENSEYNNCSQRAICSETGEEIYIVFTRVPPTLDSTAIMFAVLDSDENVIKSTIHIGTVKSISSFPNIIQSNGRIFITWHGSYSALEGFTIAEIQRNGTIQGRVEIAEALPAACKGNGFLADPTTLHYFYNSEPDEDISSIIYVQVSIDNGFAYTYSEVVGNGSCLVHHAYWSNGSIRVVYTQQGDLMTATFDQQSNTFNGTVFLETLDHFDPVVSFWPLSVDEVVVAYSQISAALDLQFYSLAGTKTRSVAVSSEAYNFSNIAVHNSLVGIAWVTDGNKVACTFWDLESAQLYETSLVSSNASGIAIEPFLLNTPNGIFVFWRDFRNHNGGDIYYRRITGE
ncbi:hypothetical protein HQ585_12320 [candidate division KSB1 bacterium]|nr:hypothetical protein [candidate division KSB1 bacterium]